MRRKNLVVGQNETALIREKIWISQIFCISWQSCGFRNCSIMLELSLFWLFMSLKPKHTNPREKSKTTSVHTGQDIFSKIAFDVAASRTICPSLRPTTSVLRIPAVINTETFTTRQRMRFEIREIEQKLWIVHHWALRFSISQEDARCGKYAPCGIDAQSVWYKCPIVNTMLRLQDSSIGRLLPAFFSAYIGIQIVEFPPHYTFSHKSC